jgi:hypothetical protein
MIENDTDVKALIDKVLHKTGYSDSRAAKMEINDILRSVHRYSLLFNIG